MTTQAKYEAFKDIYLEEKDRRATLWDNANKFVTLISGYSAFVFFVAEHDRPDSCLSYALFVATVLASVFGLLSSVLVLAVAKAERPFDPAVVAIQKDTSSDDDDVFLKDRIYDFAAAYHYNLRANDIKARWLLAAAFSLLFAIAAEASYLLAVL